MEHFLESVAWGDSRPGQAQAVVETLAALRGTGELPEELAHDARNMVTALELYCGLLEERGVLSAGFGHYAGELRLVAEASHRLVEKLSALGRPGGLGALGAAGTARPRLLAGGGALDRAGRDGFPHDGFPDEPPGEPVESLAAELEAKRNLLAALAGPAVAFSLHIHGGGLPVDLTRVDLTRVLVNLVKNAVEAMPEGGRIELGLDEFHAAGGAPWLVMKVEDNGPGIAGTSLETIFIAGYTTRINHGPGGQGPGGWRSTHRGLGLSITRAIVEAGGGRICAANRPQGGARIEIEWPVGRR